MPRPAQYPIKWNHELDEPHVDQYTIGRIWITYNPDDNRFHACVVGDPHSIITRKASPKGWDNMIYWAKKHADWIEQTEV